MLFHSARPYQSLLGPRRRDRGRRGRSRWRTRGPRLSPRTPCPRRRPRTARPARRARRARSLLCQRVRQQYGHLRKPGEGRVPLRGGLQRRLGGRVGERLVPFAGVGGAGRQERRTVSQGVQAGTKSARDGHPRASLVPLPEPHELDAYGRQPFGQGRVRPRRGVLDAGARPSAPGHEAGRRQERQLVEPHAQARARCFGYLLRTVQGVHGGTGSGAAPQAYASTWEWGRELMGKLAARHALTLPEALLDKLDRRLQRVAVTLTHARLAY